MFKKRSVLSGMAVCGLFFSSIILASPVQQFVLPATIAAKVIATYSGTYTMIGYAFTPGTNYNIVCPINNFCNGLQLFGYTGNGGANFTGATFDGQPLGVSTKAGTGVTTDSFSVPAGSHVLTITGYSINSASTNSQGELMIQNNTTCSAIISCQATAAA